MSMRARRGRPWPGQIPLLFVAVLATGAGACDPRPVTGRFDAGARTDAGRDTAARDGTGAADGGAPASDGPTDLGYADAVPADVAPPAQDASPATDAVSSADVPPAPSDAAVTDAAVDAARDAGSSDAPNPCRLNLPNYCGGQCTNVLTDVRNCGSCGQACPSRPNTDTACVQGKCIDTCKDSWSDCKTTDVTDGCETGIDTTNDCGMCGREACPGSNFIGTCVNGVPVCSTGICRVGYGNCDPASNDCETPWTSVASAGACFPTVAGIGAVPGGTVGLMFAAVAPDGVTYVAGYGEGALDLDPTDGVDTHMLPFGGVFLIRLGADGSYVWGRVIAPPDRGSAISVGGLAVGTDGSAAIAGSFSGTVDMDPGAEQDLRTSSAFYPFVTKLSAAGGRVWSKVFETDFGAQTTSIVAGPEGGFVFSGYFVGSIDLDPSAATDRRSSPRLQLPFLVALGGDGARRWASTFEQMGESCGGLDLGRMVAVPGGGLVMPGNYYGDCDLAPGTRVEKRPVTPQSAALVLKLDASGGYAGARLLRSPDGFAQVDDISVTADGTLYVAGSFDGTLDFDDGTALVARDADIRRSGFLMKMTAELGVSWVSEGMADLWVQQLETTPDRGLLAVFVQETGALAITKLDANLQPSWTMPFGGTGMQTQISDLAVGANGFVVVGTDSSGSDLDPGPGVSRVPAGAGFVARFRW